MRENFRKNKSNSIIYNPDSKYMMEYNKNEIENNILLDYILNKKMEKKKLNIKEIYMYHSDIESLRNTINRNSTSYNTNFKVFGPEYVGSDEQIYEFCHTKNLISLPEKYIKYFKYLEDKFDNNSSKSKKDSVENQIEKDHGNKDKKVKAVKIVKGDKDNEKNKETNDKVNMNNKIELDLIKDKKIGENIEKSLEYSLNNKNNTPIKTYLGSNSGYNALSRPALYTSLIQRHNAHRNKDHYNIEQVNIF